jgi:hypothetical protein
MAAVAWLNVLSLARCNDAGTTASCDPRLAIARPTIRRFLPDAGLADAHCYTRRYQSR